MAKVKLSELTDDTLKNILIMAPLLDEAGQCKVYGLMCGLISNNCMYDEKEEMYRNS